ncbi:hypothetical protein UQ79_20415, partial [Shigella dysenteriae]
ARLGRKSLSFSKSVELHDSRLKWDSFRNRQHRLLW